MGRLIDADELKKYLKKYLHYGHAIPWVDAQPTAYDPDKVVEQLEKVAFERYENDGMGGERVVNLDDVVEIVKGGVVDG